ncbi:MAG TPA: nitroreductase family deazaflavin-dependent oxidoreductase [Ktedonobacterales bacterium]|nr:nitroreductase family deazaflavin-dependent oxidoreductase [Ktedonobacterales bacterium]
MAKTSKVPRFVLWVNVLMKSLLRAGVKVAGFGTPTYLLTVRGRKSGEPRTTPISPIEMNGKRYLMAPYGAVDWVRNLRAAGEATLTRGHRAEVVRAMELPNDEAGQVLQAFVESGHPFGRFFGVSRGATREEYGQAALIHPIFVLESVAAPSAEAARSAQPAR